MQFISSASCCLLLFQVHCLRACHLSPSIVLPTSHIEAYGLAVWAYQRLSRRIVGQCLCLCCADMNLSSRKMLVYISIHKILATRCVTKGGRRVIYGILRHQWDYLIGLPHDGTRLDVFRHEVFLSISFCSCPSCLEQPGISSRSCLGSVWGQ